MIDLLLSTQEILLPTVRGGFYVDPGAGSIILQLVLGGVAGLLVAWRLFWHRITGFFRKSSDSESPAE